MSWTKWVCASLLLLAVTGVAEAAGEKNSFQVNNRLRLEYDDNIYQVESNKTDSFKIIEEVEILMNFSLQRTFVSLRYRPTFVYWDEREPDNKDLQHEFDFVLNQTFTPRLTLSLVDTLRRGLQAEIEEAGSIVQQNEDFLYNALNGTLGMVLRPTTRLEAAGRYVALRYDNDLVATNEDFDLLVGGFSLRQQIVTETTLSGDIRAEQVTYRDNEDRDSQTLSAGLGLEQIFSPNLLGSFHGGYQGKKFDSEEIGTDQTPYGDVGLTFLPSPATRISVGAGYSMYEADVYPYANQRRSQLYASLAHDFTARVAFYLSGGFTRGDYKGDQSIRDDEQIPVQDGREDVFLASTRLTYKIGKSNWLEAGWQYQDFDSDLKYANDTEIRESYTRNRLDLGWRIQF
jgi:hypothetical protein